MTTVSTTARPIAPTCNQYNADGSGRMYRPIAMICTNVLALPPGLAAMTPYLITANRSSVTPISRIRMIRVTHQARSPSMDSPIRADPVNALSAIGSAILPKSVT